MYGLVNKAVEDLVKNNFGEESWLKIKEKAQVNEGAFVSMKSYHDDVTYNLVGAATEVLGLSAEQVLEAFGEHWVLYTAKEGYGDMLDASGSTFVEFLQNLDALHVRVGNIMPELRPPSFECSDITDHSLKLHYFSDRAGLAPMVLGLVKGLGKKFNVPCQVVLVSEKSKGEDHDIFEVSW